MALALRPVEPEPEPGTWGRWYELARTSLGYGHPEAVEYANRRYVEDANRPSAHRANAARRLH